MFSCAQMWLFNIPIPTFISILFTTRVNGYIFLKKKPILNSALFECKTTMGRKKNFENSLRSPSSFQENVLICNKSVLLKSELHTCQTGILLSIDCLFFFYKMTEQKTNFGVHGHIHVTGSPKCFFHNKLFFSPVQPPECKQRKTVGFIFRILFLQ